MMLLEVVEAEYLGAYKIALVFNTGYSGTVDLEAAIFNDHRAIFKPLRDRSYFKTFTLCWNTICWDNEADFAPEFLLELARRQAQETALSRVVEAV
jgi:hypothetical protein